MRPTLTLLLALLSAAPATAAPIVLNASGRSIDTSRLTVTFDPSCPDAIRSIVFKDWHPTKNLAGGDNGVSEFFGQTLRGLSGAGFMSLHDLSYETWDAVIQTPSFVVIRARTTTFGEPPVETRYAFFADEPHFLVERVIRFSQLPDTASFQPFVSRLHFGATYRAVRYRKTSGAFVQGIYCFGGCPITDWDGHWLEQISVTGAADSLALSTIYSEDNPAMNGAVRGQGLMSFSGWAGARQPSGLHDQDETFRMVIALSTRPSTLTRLDSLYAWLQSAVIPLAAPGAGEAAAGIALAATPNPARGDVAIRFTLPRGGPAELAMFDVTGRRVATIHRGTLQAGAHAMRWDGRDAGGGPVAPGVYRARLETAEGGASCAVVRVK